MSISRRGFLKTTAIAGASVAIEGLPAWAGPMGTQAEESSHAKSAGKQSAGVIEHTRGIGNYPGAPSEDFSPALIPDNATYRNLALLRPAYHSSSYDYNLTAQLVTDGIKYTRLPEWIMVSDGHRGALNKEERDIVIDHFPTNTLELRGARASIEMQLEGGENAPEIDRVELVVVAPTRVKPESPTVRIRVGLSHSCHDRGWMVTFQAQRKRKLA
jgi:hypothetical protein